LKQNESSISQWIKQEALKQGFNACGIAKAEKLTNREQYFHDWLDKGYQADMHFLENHFDKRLDPRLMVDNARSVIVVLINYFPDRTSSPEHPKISKYAHGRDYHKVLKKKLKQLFYSINENFGPVNGRFFVDSAPVLEKEWARRAGLGWIGKNNLFINPETGSYCFIGEIICDLELEADKPVEEQCGACEKCLKACPTGALIQPRMLDTRKCIAYITLEHKGEFPDQWKGQTKNQLFGCDICQDVCPWNKKARETHEPDFKTRSSVINISQSDWRNMDEEEFENRFRGSALKRKKLEGMKENLKGL